MVKICMVTSIHPDFDARIYKMASCIAENGYDIDLVCPWNIDPGKKDGIHFLPFKKVDKRSRRYKNYSSIWKLIHSKEYDIYHFHDLDLLPVFMLFKLLRNKHVIYDMHENYPEEMLSKPYLPSYLKPFVAAGVHLLEWTGIRLIKNMVIVEEGQAERYGGKGINAILVRNFASKKIADERLDNYSQRENAVIFTGSHYESNGSLLFLEIARIVCGRKPDVRFYCINRFGNNESLRQEMHRRIQEYGLENSVRFLPNVRPQAVMEHLNIAKIALAPTLDLPRHRKAIPNKLFEYMAAGVPVVASNLPYNKQFIQDTGCGYIADPSNPEDFAEKVLCLIENSELACEMSLKGIETFNATFNWESEMKELFKLYDQLNTRNYNTELK